jgi:hypothetical protein
MESYPAGWAKVSLAINKDTKEVHVLGGDREGQDPNSDKDGDGPYIGWEILKSMMCKCLD